MKVIHVITRLIVGGAQENTLSTVLGLSRKSGVSVELISGPTTGPEGSLEAAISGLPGMLFNVPSLVRPVSPLDDAKALGHLTRLFSQKKPDIVHTHSGKAGILGRLAARRAGVPVIIHTIHGPSFGEFQGSLANFVFRSAERFAARYTTHFITVAEAMTRQYLSAGIGRPEQYTRIFSGFNLGPYLAATNSMNLRAKLGIRPDDFVVGKIARLFELKGHDDLFAVAPRLVEKCPRMKFLLVGDGPWRQRFESMARALGLENHFIFSGLIPPEKVPSHVGIMDALVHLSRREGLPRALPQALAAGRPVVSFDCDGASEVCLDNDTGFLLKPGDLDGLVDRLLRLANNPATRERLGENGRSLVRSQFSEETMVSSIHKLYEELLARKQTPGAPTNP